MAAPEDSPHPFEVLSGTAPAAKTSPDPAPYDEEDDLDEEEADEGRFGTPGPPISRHSAFYRGFWTTIGALSAIVVGLSIRQAKSVIVLLLVAIFLAVGLNPIVEWLERKGLRRRWAVLVVTLGLLSLLTLFVVALVPVLRDQINAIITNAPGWLDSFRHNGTIKSIDGKYHIIDKVTKKLQSPDLAQEVFGSLYSVGLAVVSAVFNAFLLFVLTLYFLASLPQIKGACYSLAPASRRERVTHLGDEILRRMGGYVAGAFLVALCAGTSTFIFLEIGGLGIYALALALVVMILDVIPLVGATIGAVIVTAIGFATSLGLGIACIVFYLVYQQVENYVIYPRVMRSSVDVPAVVTVVAVLVGGTLLGVVGAILAIPMAAAALLLVKEIVIRKQDAS